MPEHCASAELPHPKVLRVGKQGLGHYRDLVTYVRRGYGAGMALIRRWYGVAKALSSPKIAIRFNNKSCLILNSCTAGIAKLPLPSANCDNSSGLERRQRKAHSYCLKILCYIFVVRAFSFFEERGEVIVAEQRKIADTDFRIDAVAEPGEVKVLFVL